MLVHDDDKVYGFARDAKYYKWTTTMEHQLFCATKEAPNVPLQLEAKAAKGKEADATHAPTVQFPSEKLQVANTPLTG
jgi:hypothetical protein